MATLLRVILVTLAIVSFLAGPACSQTATSSPTTTPVAETPRRGVSTPAANADKKAEWDQTLAAAKKEGKVVVVGSTGDLYRNAAMAFQKAYPDIQLEYSGMKGTDFAPKIIAERNAGLYLWDTTFGGATSAMNVLKPNGVLDPVKPALMLPEVLDSSKWANGLDNAFMDKDGQYIFAFEADLEYSIFVNRDMVPESELSTFDQLLDPKWKGKIVSRDLRIEGAQNGCASQLLESKGEDWLRKFYSQDIALMQDERAVVESVIRGKYPIMVGVNTAALQEFRQQKVADMIKPLDANNPSAAGLTSASSHAMLINKAPHPNAAKVFLNWLLSKDGQQAYVNATNVISRRTDVEGEDLFFAPKPNVKYNEHNKESFLPNKTKAMAIAKEIFK